MWVVVADACDARIFETPSPMGELKQLEELTHQASRLKNQDFDTDGPGRVKQNRGKGGNENARTSYERKEQPKEREKKKFAKEIAKRLENGRNSGKFDRVSLIASPKFLGMLRGALTKSTHNCVVEEISKDLTSAEPSKIKEHLSRFSQ